MLKTTQFQPPCLYLSKIYVFIGAEPPKDSFEYHQRLVEPNIVALCIVIVIVTFGSALSASFFGFNITYRHHR